MNDLKKEPKKSSNIISIIAYVLASLLTLFFSVALVPKIIMEIKEEGISILYTGGWEGLVMQWTYIVFIIGFAISWKNKFIGGLIIILASLIQMGPFLIIDGNLGSLIFGLPMLIVGILLIIAHKKSAY